MKDANALRGCKNKELKYHLIGAGMVCLMKQHYGPLVANTCSSIHIPLVNVISVAWKLICVYYAFFHAEFKYVIRIALPLTGFV